MHCLHILHIHFVTKQDQKSIDLALETKTKRKKKTKEEKIKDKQYEKKTDRQIETRSTNVVRNARYARSRYTLNFF